jgi:hypothetical protein
MKNILLIAFSTLTLSIFAEARNDSTSIKNDSHLRLSSIDLSSGKGALTSGLYFNFNFKNKKSIMRTVISEKDLEITYFHRLFADKLLIGGNGGYFYNVPYAGPIIIFSPIKYVSTFHWYGWSLGSPEGIIEPKINYLMGVNAITINVWRLNASYCLINFMKRSPQHTVSLKYTQAVDTHFSISTDVGYDFLNQNQLLKVGINWKP